MLLTPREVMVQIESRCTGSVAGQWWSFGCSDVAIVVEANLCAKMHYNVRLESRILADKEGMERERDVRSLPSRYRWMELPVPRR